MTSESGESGRLQDLFARIVALPPEERRAAIDAGCGDDTELRRRVEALLESVGDARSTSDPSGVEPTLVPDPDSEVPHDLGGSAGLQISERYTLEERIGQGGMGEVWVASQTEPVRRRVALKLIKSGMNSAGVLARFEQERQALALMEHPNIARVLDGGVTTTGQPFFVMELVDGLPLDKFCDESELSLRDRLKLITAICQAVQHAHQKGIVHRDLKPANILVTVIDGQPIPKVIDFGVAKAVEGGIGDELMTQFGAVVGTLEYMSPEQAGRSDEDVDTRADIYSLGVILYEVLTGRRPFDRRRLQQAAFLEVIRIIREEEPSRPSTRLSTDEALPTVAAVRRTEPHKLMASLRGELDWIVMKCLEKDRDRRYPTASGLQQDIERYLSNEPVEARPPSAGYRIKKFLARHRAPALAIALILLSLLAGIAGTTWGLLAAREQEQIARDEADQKERARKAAADLAEKERLARRRAQEEQLVAQAVRDFLQDKLLGQANVDVQADTLLRSGRLAEDANPNPTILELLDRAAAELAEDRIEDAFPGQPLVQAEILHTVGFTYRGIGEFEKAIDFLQRALDRRRRNPERGARRTISTMSNLAIAYRDAGELGRAITLFEQTLARADAELGEAHPDTLNTLKNFANACLLAGNAEQAMTLYEKVRRSQAATLGAEHRDTLLTRSRIAMTLLRGGRRDQAVPQLEEVLSLLTEQLGVSHPRTLDTANVLAQALIQAGQLRKAHSLLETTLTHKTDTLGSRDPQTLVAMGDLAYVCMLLGDLDRAASLGERTLELRREKLGADHPETVTSLLNLALTYQEGADLKRALPLFTESLERLEQTMGADHPRTLSAMGGVASIYQDLGRMDEALSMYDEALRRMRAALPADHPYLLVGIGNLAQACHVAGQSERAVKLLGESLTLLHEPIDRQSKQAMLADNLMKLGQFADAEPVARSCLETREDLFPGHYALASAQVLLARSLIGQRKYDEAEPLLTSGYRALKTAESTIPPSLRNRLPETLAQLIALHESLGNTEEVARWRAVADGGPLPTPENDP